MGKVEVIFTEHALCVVRRASHLYQREYILAGSAQSNREQFGHLAGRAAPPGLDLPDRLDRAAYPVYQGLL